MKNISSNVDRIRVATPCPVSWDQMTGDDRVRFCDHCRLNVYNISELSRSEAETLLASTEGRLCARLYRRTDGTVLTRDCPVGLRALRMRVSKRAAAVFAALVSISSAAFGQQASDKAKSVSCPTQSRITKVQIEVYDASSNPNGNKNTIANTIFGCVHDPLGSVVPDAIMVINGPSLAAPKTIIADKDGKFETGILPPGTYSVTISSPGFEELCLDKVVIEPDTATNIEAVLQVAALTGVIELRIAPPESKPGTTIITQDMMKRLPMN